MYTLSGTTVTVIWMMTILLSQKKWIFWGLIFKAGISEENCVQDKDGFKSCFQEQQTACIIHRTSLISLQVTTTCLGHSKTSCGLPIQTTFQGHESKQGHNSRQRAQKLFRMASINWCISGINVSMPMTIMLKSGFSVDYNLGCVIFYVIWEK